MGFYIVPCISIKVQESLNWVIFTSRNGYTHCYHFLSRKSTVPGEFRSSILPCAWYHDTTFRILWNLVEYSLKGNTILLCLGIFDPNLSRQPTHEIKAFFWQLGWLFLPQAIANNLIFSLFQSQMRTSVTFSSLHSLEFSSFIFLCIFYDG